MSISVSINTFVFFFFNDTATTEIYTLSLHDALPIWMTAMAEALMEGLSEDAVNFRDNYDGTLTEPEVQIGRAHV